MKHFTFFVLYSLFTSGSFEHHIYAASLQKNNVLDFLLEKCVVESAHSGQIMQKWYDFNWLG